MVRKILIRNMIQKLKVILAEYLKAKHRCITPPIRRLMQSGQTEANFSEASTTNDTKGLKK